jgi:hypothetical protein
VPTGKNMKCILNIEKNQLSILAENKPSLEEMWSFIDTMMRPHELVSDKSLLSYDDVFSVYTKLMEIDEMFIEITQVKNLRKMLEEEKLTH